MCQYLYASFSLKTQAGEGLIAGQGEAIARWHEMLTGIAIEEMLHLALVANVMTALRRIDGAVATRSAPSPRRSRRKDWPSAGIAHCRAGPARIRALSALSTGRRSRPPLGGSNAMGSAPAASAWAGGAEPCPEG